MIVTLKKMLSRVKYPGRYVFGLTLIGLVSAILNIFFGFALMIIVNAAESANINLVIKIVILVCSVLATLMFFMPLGYWLFDTAVLRSTGRLRQKIITRIMSAPAAWVEQQHSGELTSRLTNDIQKAEEVFGMNIRSIAEAFIGGACCMAIMLAMNWKLALGLFFFGGIRVFTSSRLLKPLKKTGEQVQAALGSLTEDLTDLINGAAPIRMHNCRGFIQEKFRGISARVEDLGRQQVLYLSLSSWFNSFCGQLLFLGLIILGGYLVIRGWSSLSVIILFIQLQNGVNTLFSALGNCLVQMQSSLAGGRRALELCQLEQEAAASQVEGVPETKAAIALVGVDFSYPQGKKKVLSDLSLAVLPGEQVALIGPSGAGKTTVFKLLMGFYAPDSGAISILGRGLSEYSLVELRNQIAYVPQRPYLFSGTVKENISVGKPEATDKEIEDAAETANAMEFILELPDGYNTLVGERGSRLSGGQAQRIAIARAVLRNAPILLLDEATAALDSVSEAKVQSALTALMKGRSTIVIAHRLSTVKNVDRILVLDLGRVVEEGAHEALIRKDGLYKRLHSAGAKPKLDM